MRRAILILCLVFVLIALWLMRLAFEAPKPDLASKANDKSATTVSAPAAPKTENPPTARQPLKIASKGRVRLRPGESAVLGYWEIGPGMNGMAIVTPETTSEGHVRMTAKLLQLSDAAVSNADAQDLFPDIFDFENYSAIGPDRLRELQQSLQNTRGVDMLAMPAVVSAPGQPARISIGNSNEFMLSLGLQADPVPEDGGYDLSLDFQRQE